MDVEVEAGMEGTAPSAVGGKEVLEERGGVMVKEISVLLSMNAGGGGGSSSVVRGGGKDTKGWMGTSTTD